MLAALRCPLCEAFFVRPFLCRAGHSFDVARQGYVHLGTGGKLPEGDTAPMVQAREEVQASGLFRPLQEALARAVPHSARLIADLGAGTGHYLTSLLDERPQALGLAFDVSKPALRRAGRAHPRMGAVLADTWSGLPLADGSIDVLLNVFAPRNGPEMRRVLAPGGVLIVAAPTPRHLAELRAAAGLLDVDGSKQDRLNATLGGFTRGEQRLVRWELNLTADQAERLILMGPNAFHEHRRPGAIRTTAEVAVSTWTGRPLPTRAAHHDAGR